MIYVVFGMHKSGTTLISRTLHASGINMGEFEEAVTYDGGNHYERKKSQDINIALLGSRRRHSLDMICPIQQAARGSVEARAIENMIYMLNEQHTDWGFKDPYICLTYHAWKPFLPRHCILFVYRNPLELWHHYQGQVSRVRVIKRFLRGLKALRAWYIYNSCLLSEIYQTDQVYKIINFTRFLSEPDSCRDLAAFMEKEITDCREPALYRARPQSHWLFAVEKRVMRAFWKMDVDALYAQLNKAEEIVRK